jgi:hypothetical protein
MNYRLLRRLVHRDLPASLVGAILFGWVVAALAQAQDIEPRYFSNAPVGVNFLIGGYTYTRGGVAFDTALPITNPKLQTSSAVLGYVRVLDLWGKSGRFAFVVPYSWLSGSGQYLGATTDRNVDGFADPRFRLSVNLVGAPALDLKDFRSYRQDLIVGASLQVSVPAGQYDPDRLVNIGSHRWWFKPELGLSKAVGPWTFELTAAATLFTDNNDFLGGHKRSQDPLYSSQTNVIYSFPKGVWGSVDVTYYTGGRTTVDGERNLDLQKNWRVGATLALPVDVHNSVKLYASSGVSSRTGNDFDLAGIAWQYRWGGGL